MSIEHWITEHWIALTIAAALWIVVAWFGWSLLRSSAQADERPERMPKSDRD